VGIRNELILGILWTESLHPLLFPLEYSHPHMDEKKTQEKNEIKQKHTLHSVVIVALYNTGMFLHSHTNNDYFQFHDHDFTLDI
jgi:hypothetical protein